MREEGKRILRELKSGKKLKDIEGNRKTKLKIYKAYLYSLLALRVVDEISRGEYTLSIHELKNLIFDKKVGG